MRLKRRISLVATVLILMVVPARFAAANHFDATWTKQEPRWACHPEAPCPDQHHTHGLIVFERIHGVKEHLPLFVVRDSGVYTSIKDRTVQVAEKMDLAMDLIDEGGEIFVEKEGANYAVVVKAPGTEGHRLRVMTITRGDAIGYTSRSDPEIGSLTAGLLAQYIADYWMDMYLVFYRMEDPRHLVRTEQGKQILGMMKWSRLMAREDGVELDIHELHEYIDIMPGVRAFKEDLESLAYRIPDFHGVEGHGDEPGEHDD